MATVAFALEISKHSDVNKMNHHNMALMFSPNIIRPRSDLAEPPSIATIGTMHLITKTFECIMDNFEEIFDSRLHLLPKYADRKAASIEKEQEEYEPLLEQKIELSEGDMSFEND
jgi:hypothetical protein